MHGEPALQLLLRRRKRCRGGGAENEKQHEGTQTRDQGFQKSTSDEGTGTRRT